ncbi:hypothetical protein ABEF95_008715 [Exophiala dermatitidis]
MDHHADSTSLVTLGSKRTFGNAVLDSKEDDEVTSAPPQLSGLSQHPPDSRMRQPKRQLTTELSPQALLVEELFS